VIVGSGHTTTLDFLMPGDTVGLIESTADRRFSTLCTAMSVVSAVIVPSRTIQMATDTDPDFRRAMITHYSSETIKLRERLFEMATLSIRARVASYLLGQCDATSENADIKNPLTHEELASLLGSNREAITRTLRELDRAGILVYSRQNIRVLNLAKLQGIVQAG
jgi:CRP-like cAMP-binding protein